MSESTRADSLIFYISHKLHSHNPLYSLILKMNIGGTWVAQSVERPTRFLLRSWSQGHGFEPHIVLHTEHGACVIFSVCLSLSLSLTLSAPLLHLYSLSNIICFNFKDKLNTDYNNSSWMSQPPQMKGWEDHRCFSSTGSGTTLPTTFSFFIWEKKGGQGDNSTYFIDWA